MKKYLLLTIYFSLLCFLNAQNDYETWKKQQEKGFREYQQIEQQKFRKFKDERDSTFAEFLKREWQAFQVFKGEIPPEKPKPLKPPFTELRDIPDDIEQSSIRIEEIQLPQIKVETAKSVETCVSKMIEDKHFIEFDFFRVSLKINIDPSMSNIQVADSICGKTISDFWTLLSCSEYLKTLEQIQKIKEIIQLNDWGYILLINSIAQKLYSDSEQKQNLMVWFVMLKSGYEARVGFNQNRIYLLLPCENMMYGINYFLSDIKKYYIIDFNRSFTMGNIYTYKCQYSEHQDILSLALPKLPVVGDSLVGRHFKYNYKDEPLEFQLNFIEPLIEFFDYYPRTDIPIYFNAPLSKKVITELANELKPLIEGKSEVEAVNILLYFVQTAFNYKTDRQQYGYEKTFFAEQTLFYPYSDCEDRAILFADLVSMMLHLKVILLDYPTHISTAVKFSSDIPGDCISYKGNRFLICDPTYINANVGESIPRLKPIRPKIIDE